jgi:hypothetical protein
MVSLCNLKKKAQVRQCFGQPAQASPLGHLNILNVCKESDKPFYLLKEVLLVQFRKSK